MLRKVLQSALFNVASNAIAQRLRRGAVSTKALAHPLVWGIVRGVMTVLWYSQLAFYWPGRAPIDVAGKVALDQCFYTCQAAWRHTFRDARREVPRRASMRCSATRVEEMFGVERRRVSGRSTSRRASSSWRCWKDEGSAAV